MKRVLVTGGGGFIGRRALVSLLEHGFEVHGVARAAPPRADDGVTWHVADPFAGAGWRDVVAAVQATHLLHLAWHSDNGLEWHALENEAWIGVTVALGRAFADAGGRRAVVAGTCAEYSWSGPRGPLAEDSTPLAPATAYGRSKDGARRALEGLVPELAWTRIFFVYGPDEYPARLVASVARAVVGGRPAATTAGTQVRDYLHVDDVADALATILEDEVVGPVNVGSGTGVAVADLARMIADVAGQPDLLRVGALPRRDGEPEALVADVSRLRDEVGWKPRIPLREGLADTVAWWRAHESAR